MVFIIRLRTGFLATALGLGYRMWIPVCYSPTGLQPSQHLATTFSKCTWSARSVSFIADSFASKLKNQLNYDLVKVFIDLPIAWPSSQNLNFLHPKPLHFFPCPTVLQAQKVGLLSVVNCIANHKQETGVFTMHQSEPCHLGKTDLGKARGFRLTWP